MPLSKTAVSNKLAEVEPTGSSEARQKGDSVIPAFMQTIIFDVLAVIFVAGCITDFGFDLASKNWQKGTLRLPYRVATQTPCTHLT